jgi:hypothetical protein
MSGMFVSVALSTKKKSEQITKSARINAAKSQIVSFPIRNRSKTHPTIQDIPLSDVIQEQKKEQFQDIENLHEQQQQQQQHHHHHYQKQSQDLSHSFKSNLQ